MGQTAVAEASYVRGTLGATVTMRHRETKRFTYSFALRGRHSPQYSTTSPGHAMKNNFFEIKEITMARRRRPHIIEDPAAQRLYQ
jgi:hypothetical protein